MWEGYFLYLYYLYYLSDSWLIHMWDSKAPMGSFTFSRDGSRTLNGDSRWKREVQRIYGNCLFAILLSLSFLFILRLVNLGVLVSNSSRRSIVNVFCRRKVLDRFPSSSLCLKSWLPILRERTVLSSRYEFDGGVICSRTVFLDSMMRRRIAVCLVEKRLSRG